MNDRAVLDLLVENGAMTRTELGGRTGLSKVTMSQVLARLETRGVVEPAGSRAGGRGPNAMQFCIVGSRGHAAGVEVGPDCITVAVADLTGGIRGRAVLPGESADLSIDLRKALAAAVVEAGITERDLRAVVIGTPGVVDPTTGAVDLAVDIPAWTPALPATLGAGLDCPVRVENDVNLAALCELAHRRADGVTDFVLLWVGQGLGMAIVLDGRLHRGANGGAGEVGYLPVPGAALSAAREHPRAAALQSSAGGDAVRALAARHGLVPDGGPVDPSAVIAAAAETDHPVLDEFAGRLAVGVAAVCAVLDPGLVVLSGDVGRAGGAALADAVQALVPQIVPVRPAVRTSAVADDAVLRGAVLVAVHAARDEVFGG